MITPKINPCFYHFMIPPYHQKSVPYYIIDYAFRLISIDNEDYPFDRHNINKNKILASLSKKKSCHIATSFYLYSYGKMNTIIDVWDMLIIPQIKEKCFHIMKIIYHKNKFLS